MKQNLYFMALNYFLEFLPLYLVRPVLDVVVLLILTQIKLHQPLGALLKYFGTPTTTGEFFLPDEYGPACQILLAFISIY